MASTAARRSCSVRKYLSSGFRLTVMRPVPRERRTRATEVLRRPVPQTKGLCSGMLVGEFLRGLRLVGVLVPLVRVEFGDHLAAERAARQHVEHRVADHLLGLL